jgi:phosphatidylethanolamine/phosphatidyl-N-methylethanolamine N-methyltransferase
MLSSTPRDYSLIAPIYDRVFNRFLSQGHQRLGMLLRNKRLIKGMKVLEIGVGSGLSLDQLPSTVEYTGVDINEKMLKIAELKARVLKRRKITLSIMDAHRLAFKANSFDLVIAASVITAVENPDMVIKEMMRVTKKGGNIVVIANFRNKASFKSQLVKRMDPLTKKFLGFRTDLDSEMFKKHKGLRMIENHDINRLFGYPLSSFIVFQKN